MNETFFLLQTNANAASSFITLKDFLIFLFGSGVVVGLVALFRFLSERYDQLKQRRKERKETELSETAEIKKLQHQTEDSARSWLEKILAIRDKEIVDLKGEVKIQEDEIESLERRLETALAEARAHNSLSSQTVTKIYQTMRVIRRQIETLDIFVLRGEKPELIAQQVEVVKKTLDVFENLLP